MGSFVPSGRPKGARNKRTLSRIQLMRDATASGASPLEVMLDNMRYAHEQAHHALIRMEDALSSPPPEDAEEYRAWALGMVGEMRANLGLRRAAQEFAEGAAPYCHPRLSAVAIKPVNPDGPRSRVQIELVDSDGEGRLLSDLRGEVQKIMEAAE